jgi:hypothetical protein
VDAGLRPVVEQEQAGASLVSSQLCPNVSILVAEPEDDFSVRTDVELCADSVASIDELNRLCSQHKRGLPIGGSVAQQHAGHEQDADAGGCKYESWDLHVASSDAKSRPQY